MEAEEGSRVDVLELAGKSEDCRGSTREVGWSLEWRQRYK